jgi:RND family efflux transporter MFP subunit
MSKQRHSSLGIQGLHSHEPAQALRRAQILRRAKIAGVAVLILLALGAARTVTSRLFHARALEAATVEQAKRYVITVKAKPSDGGQPLVLPGTLQGYVESPIYARSSGYLMRWHKDIGSRVAKGELLADIDTPEVDQQLSQAVAARQQAAASLELAKSSFERWKKLRQEDTVSQQELDERRSAYAQAQANLAAAEANVRRLQQLESFKRVVAPFAGVLTRRNVDVGDLIDAGNGGTGRALFSLAQTDPLRIYVNVPQANAQLVRPGQEVTVKQAELSGLFHGTVARTAGAIDTTTRTMQIEINLPNSDGKLLPGAYVEVALPGGAADSLVVPPNTLLFRAEGPRIAVVDGSGRVKLHPVTIGRDFGHVTEIVSGITANDQLVLNPPDSLADGDAVAIAPSVAKSDQ